MKKLTAILISLLMLLLVLPCAADGEEPSTVALSHESPLFDLGVTHAAAITVGGTGYAWGYNYNGPIGNGVSTGNCPAPYNWGSGARFVSVNSKTTLMIDTQDRLWIWGETWWGIGGEPMPGGSYVSFEPVQIATNVRMASMGFNHVVFVKNDNTLWTYGQNAHGQLGTGNTNNNYTPTQIMTNVAYAAAGNCLTAAVKNDGTLWAWGYNASGQVGNNSTSDRTSPVQVLTNVFTVSTMGDHVMAIKTDGSLWAWGSNTYGQLGKGNTSAQRTPVQVMTGVAQVSAGADHTGVLKTDGSLWFCGRNYMGPFGNGSTSGYSAANPTFVRTAGSYIAVKCGNRLTGALREDGQLLVAGDNTYDQLGMGAEGNPDGTRFYATLTANGLNLLNDDPGPGVLLGDVDANGAVEVPDALMALRAAMGLIQTTPYMLEAGDVDFNGSLEVQDALLILRYTMSIISSF